MAADGHRSTGPGRPGPLPPQGDRRAQGSQPASALRAQTRRQPRPQSAALGLHRSAGRTVPAADGTREMRVDPGSAEGGPQPGEQEGAACPAVSLLGVSPQPASPGDGLCSPPGESTCGRRRATHASGLGAGELDKPPRKPPPCSHAHGFHRPGMPDTRVHDWHHQGFAGPLPHPPAPLSVDRHLGTVRAQGKCRGGGVMWGQVVSWGRGSGCPDMSKGRRGGGQLFRMHGAHRVLPNPDPRIRSWLPLRSPNTQAGMHAHTCTCPGEHTCVYMCAHACTCACMYTHVCTW